MTIQQLPHKHRATDTVPAGDRPAPTRAHRADRSTDLPVAAILGIILLVLAAYLSVRG